MAKKEKLSLDELLEQALIKNEDKPYDVPSNWVWTRLGGICKKITDGEHIKPLLQENGIPLLTAKNILDEALDFDNVDYLDASVARKSWERCNPELNDILICSRGTIGRNTLVNVNRRFCLMGTVILLKLNAQLNCKFINYVLKSELLQNNMKTMCGSTAISALYLKDIKNVMLLIPPLLEQQRIVDLIESLFEKLDRAKELAQNALDSFENRKSAILHKAFTGELTAKWREENGVDSDQDIDREKLSSDFETYLPKYELPNRWNWITLNECCNFIGSGVTPKGGSEVYTDQGIPFIRSQNVLRGQLDLSDVAYISEEINNTMKRTVIKGKETLLNITGASIGRACYIPPQVNHGNVNQHVCILRFKGYVNYKYPSYWLNSPSFQQSINEEQIDVTRQALNYKQLRGMLIPLPPIEEQKEIVRILDNLLENEQKAKELCDIIDKIDLMKKSILARAFRGELSTNNPDEESALELLKEVLKEMAQ